MTYFRTANLKRVALSSLAAFCFATIALAQQPVRLTRSDFIEPSALVAMLHSRNKPLILQVGFRVLYEGGHIPGALYCGPAREAEGLTRLRHCVGPVEHSRFIVIYCGCCPVEECPNIRPAFALLRRLGFSHVKILDLKTSYDVDWIKKGYPSVRSFAKSN